MNVCAIMATCGRHKLAERSLKFFLNQDYIGKSSLLIYNNSQFNADKPLRLGYTDEPGNGWNNRLLTIMDGRNSAAAYSEDDDNYYPLVQLINQHIDSQTGERYTNLGAIYNDALKYVPENTDVIIHWDDDDIFLENHISEGIKGLERGITKWKKPLGIGDDQMHHPCLAYKPAKSYYRHPGGIALMSNTLEPSIFVMANHIKEYGYSLTTTDQHLQWVNPLVYGGLISVEDAGIPTLIYNWGDRIPTFKTSGNATHPDNFENYRNFSQDHGDGVLTPWSDTDVHEYYNMIN